ncbi:hypothetical protein PV779_22605 [Streptomyces sp. ID01-9D]|nr:hypothetical protein [Streptomyces sp. ID01-9D]
MPASGRSLRASVEGSPTVGRAPVRATAPPCVLRHCVSVVSSARRRAVLSVGTP